MENDGAVYLGLLGKDEKNLLRAVDAWETLGPRMLMWSQGDPTDLEGFTANIIRCNHIAASICFHVKTLHFTCKPL